MSVYVRSIRWDHHINYTFVVSWVFISSGYQRLFAMLEPRVYRIWLNMSCSWKKKHICTLLINRFLKLCQHSAHIPECFCLNVISKESIKKLNMTVSRLTTCEFFCRALYLFGLRSYREPRPKLKNFEVAWMQNSHRSMGSCRPLWGRKKIIGIFSVITVITSRKNMYIK